MMPLCCPFQADRHVGVPMLVLTTEVDSSGKQQGKATGVAGWLVESSNPARWLGTIAAIVV